MAFAGGTGVLGDPYLIATPVDLWTVNLGLSKHYKVVNDIDLSTLPSGYGGVYWPGIATGSPFTGVFDGGGFTLSNLKIKVLSSGENKGLFCNVSGGAIIKNTLISTVTLENPSAAINCTMSALAAYISTPGATITNCHISEMTAASIKALDLGGITGYAVDATISDCSVEGIALTGLIVTSGVGGLAGTLDSCTISACSTKGSIAGAITALGGFAGTIDGTTISECWSEVNVSNSGANTKNGGFIGLLEANQYPSGAAVTAIENCYSWGNVTKDTASAQIAGGFIGEAGGLGVPSSVKIKNSYSSGTITATAPGTISGFLVDTLGIYAGEHCFYDSTKAGLSDSTYAAPKTTAQMKTQGTFTGWDFESIWYVEEGSQYPVFGIPPVVLGQPPERDLLVRWQNNGSGKWSDWRKASLGEKGDTVMVKSLKGLGCYKTRKYQIVWYAAVPVTIAAIEERSKLGGENGTA